MPPFTPEPCHLSPPVPRTFASYSLLRISGWIGTGRTPGLIWRRRPNANRTMRTARNRVRNCFLDRPKREHLTAVPRH
ncbi:MAG: hypothetical protein ACI4X9_00855 [Kiritimatiellia bacterium]